jgi:transcription elongation GreA/GreB family factor
MKPSPDFKQKLFSVCLAMLDERIQTLHAALNDLTEGAESKSSAGDKHETARAMMQLEHENLSRQLDELQKEKNELARIDIGSSAVIHKGSLIQTNRGLLFLSVAMGKVVVDGAEVIILSPQSPLGKKLLELRVKDSVEVNGTEYVIEEVV